jgi:hypothetical protein
VAKNFFPFEDFLPFQDFAFPKPHFHNQKNRFNHRNHTSDNEQ